MAQVEQGSKAPKRSARRPKIGGTRCDWGWEYGHDYIVFWCGAVRLAQAANRRSGSLTASVEERKGLVWPPRGDRAWRPSKRINVSILAMWGRLLLHLLLHSAVGGPLGGPQEVAI